MSAVTTEDETTQREWCRTPEQEAVVADHLAMVDQMYAGADPALVEALRDPQILGTPEVVEFLGYTRKTRVFQLYGELRNLIRQDQVPHPTAMPDTDASSGHRGARNIRGVMKGRAVHWALQSGRYRWDSINKKIVPQTEINHGGAPRSN